MKVLYDTNVLVALFIEQHPKHLTYSDLHIHFTQQNARFFIASHSLAEFYSVVTKKVSYLSFTSHQALEVIENNFSIFSKIDITHQEYQSVIQFLAEQQLTGGVIYDALITFASQKANADILVTNNTKDFKNLKKLTSAQLVDA